MCPTQKSRHSLKFCEMSPRCHQVIWPYVSSHCTSKTKEHRLTSTPVRFPDPRPTWSQLGNLTTLTPHTPIMGQAQWHAACAIHHLRPTFVKVWWICLLRHPSMILKLFWPQCWKKGLKYLRKSSFKVKKSTNCSIQRRAATPPPHALCHTPHPGPISLKNHNQAAQYH